MEGKLDSRGETGARKRGGEERDEIGALPRQGEGRVGKESLKIS